MPAFKLISDMPAAGDQPAAIDGMAAALDGGEQGVTLLGVTGSGKTRSMAGVIERVDRPALVMAPNKTLAAQLTNEFKELFPDNAVEYFVSYYDYYQPEAYIPQTDTYIEKDSSMNEEIDRLRHSATLSLLTRRDVIVVASVSAIYGLGSPQEYRDQMLWLKRGPELRPRRGPAQAGRHPLRPQRPQLRPGQVPGQGRHPRGLPGVRGAGHAPGVLRRRGRADPGHGPGHRRDRRRAGRAVRVPGHPLRGRVGPDAPGHRRHRGRAGRAPGRAGARGQAAGGPAAAHAHQLRPGDAARGRHLQRDRELLAPDRRPRPRQPAVHPDRLLPRRLRAVPGRVARDRAPAPGPVRGRPQPQGDPGRARLPAAVGDGQPAAALRRVLGAGRPAGVRLGHPRPVRAARVGHDGRAGHPPDRAGRPRGAGPPDQGPDRRPDPRGPLPGRAPTSGSWSPP